MDGIQQEMSDDFLSVLQDDDDAKVNTARFMGHDQTVTNSSSVLFNDDPGKSLSNWSPLEPLATPMWTPLSLSALPRSRFQSAFVDTLSDQVWRADMQLLEQGSQAAWSLESKAGNGVIAEQSTSHGFRITGPYGSCTDSFGTSTTAATTSSSNRSSQGDDDDNNNNNNNISNNSSAPPASAVASPDPLHGQHYQLPAPIPSSSVPHRTSSSGRLPHGSCTHLEAELPFPAPSSNHSGTSATLNHPNLRRTTSCSDQYEIQKALSLLEAQETHSDQWRQLQAAAAGDLQLNKQQQQQGFSIPGSSWQQQDEVEDASLVNNNNTSLSSRRDFLRCNLNSSSRMNRRSRFPQPLLRRHTLSAMEVLKEVDTYHQDQAAADQATSDVSYEFVNEDFKFFDQPAHVEMNTPRMSPTYGSGCHHARHTEAAVNHMLAERRRRMKQKENFATLRRLVPIISKGDKVSTLVDAIAYLKDLQKTIVDMEASKEAMDQRCENLANKCMEIEEQNKKLVAIILSKGKIESMKS